MQCLGGIGAPGRNKLLDERQIHSRADYAEAPVAETAGFLLPAMPSAACACHAADVPLGCLIVDDSASFLEAAAHLLKGEGVTVVGVASAIADALRQAQELSPDVVLVDIMLGRESGFDLAQRLAEKDGFSPAVILISTHAEADFADLIEGVPVAGFVAKAELSARAIRRLLAAP